MDGNDRLSLDSRRDFGTIALPSLLAAGLLARDHGDTPVKEIAQLLKKEQYTPVRH